jgi:hypothetical protein
MRFASMMVAHCLSRWDKIASVSQQTIATFLKVTADYWPGLLHCYDEASLPHTNIDLEKIFGSRNYHFSGPDLAPRDLTQWRTRRQADDYRHEARREHCRCRKDPEGYLRALEEQLSQRKMRSWFF